MMVVLGIVGGLVGGFVAGTVLNVADVTGLNLESLVAGRHRGHHVIAIARMVMGLRGGAARALIEGPDSTFPPRNWSAT